MQTKIKMKSGYSLIVLQILFLIITACNGQNKRSSIQSAKTSEDLVTEMINTLMTLPSTPPGMSIAMSSNDSIVFAEGFGYSNIDSKKPISTKTQFRAASVSKIITATVLAKLMEEGTLDVEEPIHKYVPSYSKKVHPITIKQLSGHLGGIPHYSNQDKIDRRHYHTLEDAIGVFSHIPLISKPGDQYKYSTHSYTLLSYVLEKAAHKNFLDLLNEKICQPLHMNNTGPHLIDKPSSEMTTLYKFKQNEGYIKILHPEDPSYKWGGGGLISTPTDLVKMANAYTNGFIRKDIVDDMFKTQFLNSGKATGVGIGWRQNWDIGNRKVYEHAGGMGGTRTVISLFPDEKFSIALMFNAMGIWRIEETAHMLALPFLTKASPIKQPKGFAQLKATINKEGEQTIMNGKLILDGSNNRLVLSPNTEQETTYKLIYMERGNIYALIHPHGILYSEINLKDSLIKGKAMYYMSSNITKPSLEKPFLEFEGTLKN